MKNFVQAKELKEIYGWSAPFLIQLRKCDDNFRQKVVKKVGGKILYDLAALNLWIKENGIKKETA